MHVLAPAVPVARSSAAALLVAILAAPGDARAQAPPPWASTLQRSVDVVTRQGPPSPALTDVERRLLDRIEQLERRISELETQARAEATAEGGKATHDVSSPAPATLAQEAPKAEQEQAPEKREVTFKPYGILAFNTTYNSASLVPGSIAFFAATDVPTPSRAQLKGSPGNTVAGVEIRIPPLGGWTFEGNINFNFRGQTPVTQDNVFTPYFANLYLAGRKGHHRLLLGQTGSVVSPLGPRTLNMYPASTIPGNVGGQRPQVRYELEKASGERTFGFQIAMAQPIQTYQLNEETVGEETSAPDGQVRVAFGHGSKARTFELGIGGHVGRRRSTMTVPPFTEHVYATWSGDLDVMARIGPRAVLKAEMFAGAVLGDYGAGILHTFNPFRQIPIRAYGGWGQLEYQADRRWSLATGYGLDNTKDDDLSSGFRSKNEMIFANVLFAITPRLYLGKEISYWRTKWVDLSDGLAFRFESSFSFLF